MQYMCVECDAIIAIITLNTVCPVIRFIRMSISLYSSMYFDEDGDLAHEFYEEERLTSSTGVVRWCMKRVIDNLMPQVCLGVLYLNVHEYMLNGTSEQQTLTL